MESVLDPLSHWLVLLVAETHRETEALGGPPLLWLAPAAAGALVALGSAAMLLAARGGRAGPVGPGEAYLVDLDRVSRHDVITLARELSLLGRQGGEDGPAVQHVALPSPEVGRLHALIERRADGFWIMDLDTLNGTFVNDARIDEPRRLGHGDAIRLHDVRLRFGLADFEESDVTQMAGEAVDADDRTRIGGAVAPALGAPTPVALAPDDDIGVPVPPAGVDPDPSRQEAAPIDAAGAAPDLESILGAFDLPVPGVVAEPVGLAAGPAGGGGEPVDGAAGTDATLTPKVARDDPPG